MSSHLSNPCPDQERLLLLYVLDELAADEREALEQHLAACAACAAALERERRWSAALAERPLEEPSAFLLAQARGSLSEALDDAADRSLWMRLDRWLPVRAFFRAHPAWAAALCVLFGLLVGNLVPRWLESPSRPAAVYEPAMVVVDPDLQTVGINGISVVPGADPRAPSVVLRVVRERPEIVSGTVDDSEVRRMLIGVVQGAQRFDAGLRLDSLEVLRARTDDAQVRDAFCSVARNDRNPAVRLKALEALRGFEDDARVRQTLVEVLLRDENPGARIEAINSLRALLERSQDQAPEEVLDVLRDRMQHDPSTYIRMQSAAAVRQVASRSRH
jgi:hypothetical protein